jgi:hypothetical protein
LSGPTNGDAQFLALKTEAISKNGFWFKVKAGARCPALQDFPLVQSSKVGRNPEEYSRILKT